MRYEAPNAEMPTRNTLEEEYMDFFSEPHVRYDDLMEPQDDFSLEQPPSNPYVQTYTTYGVAQPVIR